MVKKRPKLPPRIPDVLYRGIRLPGHQFKNWAEYDRYQEMREAGKKVERLRELTAIAREHYGSSEEMVQRFLDTGENYLGKAIRECAETYEDTLKAKVYMSRLGGL